VKLEKHDGIATVEMPFGELLPRVDKRLGPKEPRRFLAENEFVTKLRYDPLNPDPALLRQVVFARLRLGWHLVESADFEGARLREGFEQVVEFTSQPGPWQNQFLDDVYSLLWELVREGIIRPGYKTLKFPHLTVTEYGRRVIAAETAHPHEVERFLDQIRKKQQIDPTVEAYFAEALHSFRANRLVSSAICLGVAAERVFLLIAEALLGALSNSNEQADLKKVLDLRAMKPKQDWVHRKLEDLDKSKRKPVGDFPESTPLIVTGIYDLIRQQRNDLGHPRDVPPKMDREQLEANVLLFSRFYVMAERLRSYLIANEGAF
jgi:hypothetical protein